MRIFLGLSLIMTMALNAGAVCAQTWPARHVTMIVPFGPGSGADVVGRIMAAEMSVHLGQQVIVENFGGAGGTIGVDRVAKATPDGYQIVLSAVDTSAQARFLYKQIKYDSVKDFAPIALIADQPLLLTVRPSMPVSNIKEFVEYARNNQEKMQFGSGGIGAGPYLACALVNKAIGINVTHVPYRGSAPALQDLAAGTLDFYCPLMPAALGLVSNNAIKALAVLTEDRSELMPELPTAKEQGLPVTGGYSWFGLYAPKGTPDAIVQKLNAVVRASLSNPATRERLKGAGSIAVSADRQSSEYLVSYLDKEIEKWGAIMKAAGIEPQ